MPGCRGAVSLTPFLNGLIVRDVMPAFGYPHGAKYQMKADGLMEANLEPVGNGGRRERRIADGRG
jgi:hypothetical protein